MQQRHQLVIDKLLENSFEERIYEDLFTEVLLEMDAAQHDKVAPYLCERFPLIAERLGLTLPSPTLNQAKQFVASRLDAIFPDEHLPGLDDELDDAAMETLLRELEAELILPTDPTDLD